jgi:hypothetical protein
MYCPECGKPQSFCTCHRRIEFARTWADFIRGKKTPPNTVFKAPPGSDGGRKCRDCNMLDTCDGVKCRLKK